MEIKRCRVYDRICKELFVLNFQSPEIPSMMSFIVNNWRGLGGAAGQKHRAVAKKK